MLTKSWQFNIIMHIYLIIKRLILNIQIFNININIYYQKFISLFFAKFSIFQYNDFLHSTI